MTLPDMIGTHEPPWESRHPAGGCWSAWAASHQGIVINLSDVQRLDELGTAVLVHCLSLSNRTHTKTAICCWGNGPTKTLDELGWSPFIAPHLRFESEAE